jgi:hypothetical protein
MSGPSGAPSSAHGSIPRRHRRTAPRPGGCIAGAWRRCCRGQSGHPGLLADWIRRDGLRCLKIKLRGDDEVWDYRRLVEVGRIGIEHDVHWLSADFNCTVTDPDCVNQILHR